MKHPGAVIRSSWKRRHGGSGAGKWVCVVEVSSCAFKFPSETARILCRTVAVRVVQLARQTDRCGGRAGAELEGDDGEQRGKQPGRPASDQPPPGQLELRLEHSAVLVLPRGLLLARRGAAADERLLHHVRISRSKPARRALEARALCLQGFFSVVCGGCWLMPLAAADQRMAVPGIDVSGPYWDAGGRWAVIRVRTC